MNLLPLLRLLTSLFFCFLTPSESTLDLWDGPFSMQKSIAPLPNRSDGTQRISWGIRFPKTLLVRLATAPFPLATSMFNFNPLQSCL